MLLHDAPEYVIGDMISPFKAAIGDTYKGWKCACSPPCASASAWPPRRRRSPACEAGRPDRRLPGGRRLAGFAQDEAERYFGSPVDLPEPVLALAEPWPTAEAEMRFVARFRALCPD